MPTHVTESTGASITAEWEFTTGTIDVNPTGNLKADVIAESTSATGVTIDGVLLKDGDVFLTEYIELTVFAPDATLTAVSDAAQFVFPFTGYITSSFCGVSTAPQINSGGTSLTVDFWVGTTTIFSTELTLDRDETKSTTATTPAVIAAGSSAFSQWDIGRIHVNAVGTTPAEGLIVVLTCERTA